MFAIDAQGVVTLHPFTCYDPGDCASPAYWGRQELALREYPSQETLRRLFDYDPETGVLQWKCGIGTKIKAGKIAGSIITSKHRQIKIAGIGYLAHVLAWIYTYGARPSQMDHVNGIHDDNRLINLRACTHSQNQQNRTMYNSLGYKGVTQSRKNFRVQIRVGGRKKDFGTFTYPQEAHAAYIDAARKIHGDFLHHSLRE